ncbi:monovalent cation/H+ antiporter complex subunit F [Agrococcus sp. ARC_14]|uniref:monovalent cation/H+ antiporter complex subunit F n=1 Tax=Agrococcus sp. ARC_14 TaxID=2919927 RepID=UPI001F0525DF|nr:monovalent cation/H+ antiporter complex subunit F [Agrococcus sp. ARC_14]MCH1882583.1 monovalent cation/H+ antiporter complex subunit F [Agrococcus sp. ARC_14]
MDVILIIAGVMLVVAAALTLVRIVRGPGPADRVVATDVLITTVAGSLAVEAAINRHSYTIAVIVVLSLLAFAGTVSMARFVAGREGVVGTGPAAARVDPAEGDAPAEPPAGDQPAGDHEEQR